MHVALKWPRNRGIRDFYHLRASPPFGGSREKSCESRPHAKGNARSLATRNGELARAQATSIPEYDHSNLL